MAEPRIEDGRYIFTEVESGGYTRRIEAIAAFDNDGALTDVTMVDVSIGPRGGRYESFRGSAEDARASARRLDAIADLAALVPQKAPWADG